jgi:predicted nucleotidyltransferase
MEGEMATVEESQAVLKQLSPTQEKVDLAVRTAISVARPSRVYLFGSWPRGEARWDSDLDLAVLAPDTSAGELAQIRKELRRSLDQIPMSVDLILATESYAEQFTDSVNSIFYTIFEHGSLVYGSGKEIER